MSLTKFQKSWSTIRAFLILGTVLVSILCSLKSHGWNVEMEYIGPGSEYEKLDKEIQDKKNEEAFDRVNEGSRNDQDLRDARHYERDHGV